MEFEKRYQQLNAAQKKAVDTIEGPVMVIAGPGTGKTELLGVRIANILRKTDTLPQNILCLTFTDSGAIAMRERLISIIGPDAYKVPIHTFHSFGTEVISQNREYFYRGATFQAADDIRRYEIMRSIFDELDYKNPLASMMNGEYTYLQDALKVISELKRSGLTSEELRAVLDANEAAVDAAEKILVPLIQGSVSAKTAQGLEAALPQLQALSDSAEVLFEITPLITVITDSLSHVLDDVATIHPTKPVTAWKGKWFTKDAKGEYCLASRSHHLKLRALASVYFEYLARMEQAGLYDYDDMILQVVHAMEVYDDLRFNLQEKYLYIMVDEFQDTNLAQLRILHSLTDNPVNEGSPNILVVGDDDQAIYSFQGADISNILSFRDTYPTTQLITLKDNYRSIESVVAAARDAIVQSQERLETTVAELDKTQTAHNTSKGAVEVYSAASIEDERQWLVSAIADDIKSGITPSDITILTRRHSDIHGLLPYFQQAGIAVNYEQQDDVLAQPPIMALELLARVVVAISRGDHETANVLMPELLAHPACNITPVDLWRLSTEAYRDRKSWLEVMSVTPAFLPIHTWLIELAALAPHTALEPMIDRMLGRPSEEENNPFSPFFEHYFGIAQLEKAPHAYLSYLASLRTLRSHLRDYRSAGELTVASLIDYIESYRRLNIPLRSSFSSFDHQAGAVNIMTAHKSKGLEFDTVYVFNAVDSVWGQKARGGYRLIGYPENLPLAPAGDTVSERLRLFYVAMTRAKRRLRLSFSHSDEKGKESLVAWFLATVDEVQPIAAPATPAEEVQAAESAWYQPLITPNQSLKEILSPFLSSYKLSATHLNTFMDITNGGPQAFLMNHLLHFPAAKSASASYGSAIHATLQQIHTHLVAEGELKPLEDVLKDFEQYLRAEHLTAADFDTYLQKGAEQLPVFLEANASSFHVTQKPELSFAHQEVRVGAAHLTGMIDVADIDEKAKTITVTDYKTGKPARDWKGRTEYEKIKLYKYRQQLLFYKILVEHSRDYGHLTATTGELCFVEADASGNIMTLDLAFSTEEVERLCRLIERIWHRIMALDLPDISQYEPTLKGILAFEQDLLDSTP